MSLIRIAYRSAGTLSVALPLKKNITPPPATSHKLYLLKEGWDPMNFSSFASCYLPIGIVLLLRFTSSLYIVGTASLLCIYFISVSYLFFTVFKAHMFLVFFPLFVYAFLGRGLKKPLDLKL